VAGGVAVAEASRLGVNVGLESGTGEVGVGVAGATAVAETARPGVGDWLVTGINGVGPVAPALPGDGVRPASGSGVGETFVLVVVAAT
jgi:hypothetical protein